MDLSSSPTPGVRKPSPDKAHRWIGQAPIQTNRTCELFSPWSAMSIPLKCMVVLSILARAQLIRSLVINPLEVEGAANVNSSLGVTSNLATTIVGGPSGAPYNSSQANGTFNKEISDLFNDLSTISNSLSPREEPDDNSLIISSIVANILIFVIGFCGNSLVILVILRFTRIETVTDIYILNLAFADLMFLFGLIFLIITMFIDHWIFGTLMCKLYMASTSLNQFASSLLLVVMSFDRFLAVCHPIYAQRFRRLRKAKIICFCIWIACLVMMTPIFLFAKTNQELTCAIFWPEYKTFNYEIAFTMYSFGIGFAIPLLLIAGFYTCVIRKLRIAASGPISLGSTRRSRSRETTNKRIEHLVIGIICTYTVCWLPYWITQLCVSFSTKFERAPIEGFYHFVLVATCLSYTNSALNPILYAFLSDNFKRRCAEVFRSIYSVKWCRRPQSQSTHSTVGTGMCEHSEANNNNHHHSNNFLRPESRQTIVMNESVRLMSSPSRYSETPTRPSPSTTTTNQTCAVGGSACELSGKTDQDCSGQLDGLNNNNNNNVHQSDEDRLSGANQSLAERRPDRHRDRDHANICIHHAHNKPDGSREDLNRQQDNEERFYEMDTINNGGALHDNQTRRKSVAFSIGTVVVQGPNNNGPIVKSDHKILQVTDKKLQQQCQEAV